MDEGKVPQLKVEIRRVALKQINKISLYIFEEGYPLNAHRWAERIYGFTNSFNTLPLRFSLCRYKRFVKRELRCAVFENTYIIAYKVKDGKILIYSVIHSKRLKN